MGRRWTLSISSPRWSRRGSGFDLAFSDGDAHHAGKRGPQCRSMPTHPVIQAQHGPDLRAHTTTHKYREPASIHGPAPERPAAAALLCPAPNSRPQRKHPGCGRATFTLVTATLGVRPPTDTSVQFTSLRLLARPSPGGDVATPVSRPRTWPLLPRWPPPSRRQQSATSSRRGAGQPSQCVRSGDSRDRCEPRPPEASASYRDRAAVKRGSSGPAGDAPRSTRTTASQH